MGLTVKEAHFALASAIQDPISGPDVIDGARFSADLRNIYLYRAMMRIESEILLQVATISLNKAIAVLNNVLPYMVTTKPMGQMNYNNTPSANELEYYFLSGDEDPNSQYAGSFINMAMPLFFTIKRDIASYPESRSSVDTIKVPIIKYGEYLDLVNAKHLQVANPVAAFVGTEPAVMNTNENYSTLVFKIFTANVYNAADQYDHSIKSTLHYIRYPEKPDYINKADINIDFEPGYYERILREAAIMALLDSDDMQNIEILQTMVK